MTITKQPLPLWEVFTSSDY